MDTPITPLFILFSLSSFFFSHARLSPHDLRFLSPAATTGHQKFTVANNATNWAVLIAGSNGYENYRHQADICHAYQILKRGGLKDENIVVLMYDDIANNEENPEQGTIINSPNGSDVYNGVPKDYTGNDVTASNLLAVILGDSQAVQGGSGKVVNSGPNDHIFIYYADHGGPGILSMPVGDDLNAKDFVGALTKKYNAGTYARMVIYVEACESGSIFEGLLPQGMNIYVTTASNSDESSYATYCPGEPNVPTQYTTCLGDLYSVSWMEDSDAHDPSQETLERQYQIVEKRTIGSGSQSGSHVMQYGDVAGISSDVVGLYIGASKNHRYQQDQMDSTQDSREARLVSVDQYEADIIYLREKARRAPKGSKKKADAERELEEALAHRKRVDQSFKKIGNHLFGGVEVLKKARPAGQPLVDDWDCLKSMVRTYERECGALATYGKKYMRAFANICNAGVQHQANFSQACTITP